MTQSMIKELVEKVRNEQNVNVCRRLMRNIIDKIVVKGKTFSIYYSDKVITLINEDSDPDDFDGGSGGNKNNPNNDNNGSESDKNPKSSLRDGLVEVGGIEPPSKTLSIMASTCLVRLICWLYRRHIRTKPNPTKQVKISPKAPTQAPLAIRQSVMLLSGRTARPKRNTPECVFNLGC